VYHSDGTAYCLSIIDAFTYKNDQAQITRQTNVVKEIYNSLVWPTPALIMQQLILGQPSVVDNLFAPNAKGRVDPAGQFHDHEGIIEYFYGFVYTGVARVRDIVFHKLTSQGFLTSVSVSFTFDIYDNAQQNILYNYNLTQSGTYTFDANGQVTSTDLIIHNLGAVSNPFNPPGDLTTIYTLCALVMDVAKCNSTNDPNGYYQDTADCINHMQNIYPWGTWDNLWFGGNSTVCRYFHALLAIGRPNVHCSHTGRSGGGKCINHAISTYYDQKF
jgi:hypothetical protein